MYETLEQCETTCQHNLCVMLSGMTSTYVVVGTHDLYIWPIVNLLLVPVKLKMMSVVT